MPLKAIISNIALCSLHDGDGVRAVVYFKGCGLNCKWCHNPETNSKKPEIIYTPVKCICCGRCIEVCPSCHIIKDGKMEFLRKNCTGCGKCFEACPTGALSLCGEYKTVSDVFNFVMKDAHYYEATGGGVTLSGGECLLWSDFCAELLKKCKENGVNTAIETALFVDWLKIQKVIPYVDLFYADLKIPNSKKHEKYTGSGNELIIENMQKLTKEAKRVIIRIPLIPTVNDGDEDIKGFAEIIKTLGKIEGVEVLKYNNLAEAKYNGVGKSFYSFAKESQSDEETEEFCKKLRAELADKINVFFEK